MGLIKATEIRTRTHTQRTRGFIPVAYTSADYPAYAPALYNVNVAVAVAVDVQPTPPHAAPSDVDAAADSSSLRPRTVMLFVQKPPRGATAYFEWVGVEAIEGKDRRTI